MLQNANLYASPETATISSVYPNQTTKIPSQSGLNAAFLKLIPQSPLTDADNIALMLSQTPLTTGIKLLPSKSLSATLKRGIFHI